MRASKKAKEQPTTTPDIGLDADGVLCLRGALFWKWRALDAELRTAALELEQTQTRIATEIAKNTELAALINTKAALAGQLTTARAELNTVQEEIQGYINVSLKDCAFDDKTGRLYNLTTDKAASTPLKPPKHRVRKTS